MFDQTSIRRLALAGTIAAFLTACAGDSGKYPSLAIRDSERSASSNAANGTTTSSAVITPLDEASLERVAEHLADAKVSHQRFMEAWGNALDLARAANGKSTDSDSRARAMIALAQLSAWRGKTRVSLSRLDALEVKAASEFVETHIIKAAQTDVQEMLSAQDADFATVEQAMR